MILRSQLIVATPYARVTLVSPVLFGQRRIGQTWFCRIEKEPRHVWKRTCTGNPVKRIPSALSLESHMWSTAWYGVYILTPYTPDELDSYDWRHASRTYRGWCIWYFFTGKFPHKSPVISSSFAERDLQLTGILLLWMEARLTNLRVVCLRWVSKCLKHPAGSGQKLIQCRDIERWKCYYNFGKYSHSS